MESKGTATRENKEELPKLEHISATEKEANAVDAGIKVKDNLKQEYFEGKNMGEEGLTLQKIAPTVASKEVKTKVASYNNNNEEVELETRDRKNQPGIYKIDKQDIKPGAYHILGTTSSTDKGREKGQAKQLQYSTTIECENFRRAKKLRYADTFADENVRKDIAGVPGAHPISGSSTIADKGREKVEAKQLRYADAFADENVRKDVAGVPGAHPILSNSTIADKGREKVEAKQLRYADAFADENVRRNVGGATGVQSNSDISSDKGREKTETKELQYSDVFAGENVRRNLFEPTAEEEEKDRVYGDEERIATMDDGLYVDKFSDTTNQDERKGKRNIMSFIVGIVLLLAMIVLVTILVITNNTKEIVMTNVPSQVPSQVPSASPSASPSMLPSETPSLVPTTTIAGKIGLIIETTLPSSKTLFRKIGTAQNKAFLWILESITEDGNLPEEERVRLLYSLAVLFYGTDGNNWVRKDRWLNVSVDVCDWYGVTKCAKNQIIELNLSNNNLIGSIPDEVVFLGSIETIDLTDNRLDGVSKELATLSSLTSLWLHNNELTGRVPKEVNEFMISNQKNYSDIILEKVPMDEIAIFEHGSIQFRVFQSILHRIKNDEMAFREEDLWQRYVLSVLYYSTGGDGWNYTNNWLSLKSYCDWNAVNQSGVFCKDDNEVDRLLLGTNYLVGSIPKELGALTELTYLSLADNSLNGSIPTEFGRLTNLNRLFLSRNDLKGEIPSQFDQLTKLQNMWLNNNKNLSGTIPEVLCNVNNWIDKPWIDCKEITCNCCRGLFRDCPA